MECCDKVKELEQRINFLEDMVFGMNCSPKKNEQPFSKTQDCCKQFGDVRSQEVAKMFKHGWLCKDKQRVMWVPKRPKGFPLWNKQKGGVELNVDIESDKNPYYVDCKTGKKFSRILLRDVKFQKYDDYRCRTFTLDELEEQFIDVGNSFTVKVMKGNTVLRDDETLKHLIDEINATYEDWNAIKGRLPETIGLIKM